MTSETQINIEQLAALAEEVSKTKREQTVAVRPDVVAVLKPTRGNTAGRKRQAGRLAITAPLPDQDALERFFRQEQAIRTSDGGIVSATAGALQPAVPAKSAEELRELAEEAIAHDRLLCS